MAAPETALVEHLSPEERSALMLRIWEALSSERDMQSVLAELGSILQPVVPFSSVGIVEFADPAGPRVDPGEEPDRLYALHIVGIPSEEGESWEQMLERVAWRPEPLLAKRPLVSYPETLPDRVLRGEPYVCDDLLDRPGWLQHEFYLAQSGVRTYTSIPLLVRGRLIGTAVFSRFYLQPYRAEEIGILQDVVKALSVAAANAMANEKILKLRSQLEAENLSLRAQLGKSAWSDDIVAASPATRRVLEKVDQVAHATTTVLITGETGTGKEVIARAVHRRSPRAHGPLVKVNCSAIPESLLASELFGHERGAFTGATQRRKGRFEQAHGGTLFLDEIGELSPNMQVLLLRVLQEREFERLGGSQTLHVDVRLVAATNRDLQEEVRAGRFRSDLFYRLSVFPIQLPALRERPEDIAPLVAHFLQKHSTRLGREPVRMEKRTLDALQRYHWPGNVRELENVVERGLILAKNGVFKLDRLALAEPVDAPEQAALPAQMSRQEREAIEAALRASRGKISGEGGAAERLGLKPSTLEFRIKRLEIDKFSYRKG